MYRTARQKARWMDRSRLEPGSLHSDNAAPSRDSRQRTVPTGVGPYEASYDIVNGYGEDRAILMARDSAELHRQPLRTRRD